MPSVSTPLPTWRIVLRLVWVYVRLLLGALFKPRWLIRPEPHWQSLPMPLLPPAEAHATRTLKPHKLAQYKQLVGWASDTDPLHAPKPPGTTSGPAISTGTHAGGGAPGAHAHAPARAPGLQQQQGGHAAAPVLQRQTVAAWGPCVLPAVFLFTDAFPLAMEVLSQLPFSVLGGVVNKRTTHTLLRPELPPGTHLLHRAAVTRDVRLTRSGHTEFDLVLATAVAQSGELVYEATLTMVLLSETATKKKTHLTAPTPPTPPPSLADVGGETGGGGGAGTGEAGGEEQPTLRHQPEAGRPVLGAGMGGGVLRKLSAAAHELAPAAASALTSAAAPDVAGLLHELGGTRQGQEEGARPGIGTGVTGKTGAAAVQQGPDARVQSTTKQELSPSAPRAGGGNHSTAAELSSEVPGKAVAPETGGAGAAGTSQGAPEQLPLVGGFRLKGGAGRAWAALDGDISPMHLWPWTAKLSGFPRPVANVQLLLGSTEALLRSQGLIPPSARPVQISAEFKRPCLLPQELVVHAGAAAVGGSEVAAGPAGAGGGVAAQAHAPRLTDGGVVAFVVASAKDGRPFAVGQAAWGTAARS